MIDFSDLIGVPFLDGGRDPKKGLDCYGLAIEVYRRMGKSLIDIQNLEYELIRTGKIEPTINIKPTQEIKLGTGLEFITKDKRLHVAVAINNKMFIHATESQGVRISTFNSCKAYMTLIGRYEVL